MPEADRKQVPWGSCEKNFENIVIWTWIRCNAMDIECCVGEIVVVIKMRPVANIRLCCMCCGFKQPTMHLVMCATRCALQQMYMCIVQSTQQMTDIHICMERCTHYVICKYTGGCNINAGICHTNVFIVCTYNRLALLYVDPYVCPTRLETRTKEFNVCASS